MKTFTVTILSSAMILMGSVQAATAGKVITEAELQAAQQAWGKALISISQAYTEGGHTKAEQTARAVLDGAYGYNLGPVLFKPTLASGEQTFRTEYDGALAYFVGGNSSFANDSGFALKGWQAYEFNNAAVHVNGDLALTMGHVMLTDSNGQVTTVDKTWGFKKDEQGVLRIVLHHSSLPFSAN
ncbi:phosphoribosyl-AMP cyclohydrolase [Arsukibacterium ikkense]|uniref:Phosphoribosyl-AMP cyclohydrolase n=1 Tax=Arsukibacterium ikkense TaxID=336831 RepID=A0A0M2V0U7_9GAMM|nr:phosphoribosyl-AMP cyclohydrolase [Arsukibacterium ikkense]KKO43969.1 phosphoribosyl-AMP cyclohydrolase [Arsukibacterium ikkense]